MAIQTKSSRMVKKKRVPKDLAGRIQHMRALVAIKKDELLVEGVDIRDE